MHWKNPMTYQWPLWHQRQLVTVFCCLTVLTPTRMPNALIVKQQAFLEKLSEIEKKREKWR